MVTGLKWMLFKQHHQCAVESSEQLSTPQAGLEQPQDHLYTRANSADPASLVNQTEEGNEIFLFMLTSVSCLPPVKYGIALNADD